jgi:hypothetical protein
MRITHQYLIGVDGRIPGVLNLPVWGIEAGREEPVADDAADACLQQNDGIVVAHRSPIRAASSSPVIHLLSCALPPWKT